MSQNESPKIEPVLTSIESAPSIAPAAEIKADSEAPKIEIKAEESATKIEAPAAAEPSLPPAPKLEAKTEAPKAEAPKAEARFEAKITRMPALRKEEPARGPEVVVKPRVGRFALLAACVAIAASFGAVGGSLGVAKFGPMFIAAPAPAPVTRDHVAEEVKSLKDTVAQLRSTTRSLSENLAALKTSVNSSNAAQNSQIGKIAETLDRVEKTQTEQRKTAAAAPAPQMTSTTQAAAAASDITGSIGQRQVPMVLGTPPQDLKPPVVQGWVLRRVYDGAALIEGRDGIIEVEPGTVAPGLGRIEGIKRQDGRWVVLTARGVIVGR